VATPTHLCVIRWRDVSPKRRYYIRGIDSTGKFFGEVAYEGEFPQFPGVNGVVRDVVGCLTAEELRVVIELVERIRTQPDRLLATTDVSGVLADGPISNAAISESSIIYRSSPATKDSPSEADFVRITDIIRRHIGVPE
jgi:hypothetical protein